MPKLLGLGRNPFRPLEQSYVQSVSRYGRPGPYKQTLHNRSGAPPWSRAQLAPRPRNNSGTPEPPCYQVQVNISQFSISQYQRLLGPGKSPSRTPEQGYAPSCELAEEPRASLNNSYNIFLLSHATGANRLKQLVTKHHTLLTLRNTKLTRPPRGGSPFLGNKKRRSPRETTTPEVLNSLRNYTRSLSPGENYLSSSTYVLGACHLPWPLRFSGRYVFGRL